MNVSTQSHGFCMNATRHEWHGKMKWKEDGVTVATNTDIYLHPSFWTLAAILGSGHKAALGLLINGIHNAIVISAFCYGDRVVPSEQSNMLPSTESPVYHLKMQ